MGTFLEVSTRKQRRRQPLAADPVAFAQERFGFTPDELQSEVLRSTAPRGILNCSRQSGKSTVAALKAVHRAWTVPNSLVVVASPGERQSGEFLRKARGFVKKLGARATGDGDNKISIELPNGSRLIGLPGTEETVRGFSAVSMMIIDEAARVEDDLYKSLRPMLAVSGGDLWLLSTPFGRQGFFYETWEHGGTDWFRMSMTAAECPRILPAFLEDERRVLGNLWFRQEYLCEFVDNGWSVFGRELVEAALEDSPQLF